MTLRTKAIFVGSLGGTAFACPPLEGTLDWEKAFPDPAIVVNQAKRLLVLV